MGLNARYRVGNIYAGQARAITKGVIWDVIHSAGERDARQAGAAIECIGANAGYRIGQRYTRHCC